MLDYLILGIVAALGIGVGLFTLHEAKKLKVKGPSKIGKK